MEFTYLVICLFYSKHYDSYLPVKNFFRLGLILLVSIILALGVMYPPPVLCVLVLTLLSYSACTMGLQSLRATMFQHIPQPYNISSVGLENLFTLQNLEIAINTAENPKEPILHKRYKN